VRILTIADMSRLRGSAAPSTHLARYDLANGAPARAEVKNVLDVACPDCGAVAGVPCGRAKR
jgi:hypothetical protein